MDLTQTYGANDGKRYLWGLLNELVNGCETLTFTMKYQEVSRKLSLSPIQW